MSAATPPSPWSSTAAPQTQQPIGPACDECRQKKVKCDRVQPRCGLCIRNGLSCGFSNRVRRVNHARQLVDDVAGLNERLDSIDGVTQQLLQRMDTITELLHKPQRVTGQRESRGLDNEHHLLQKPVETSDNIAAEAPKLVQSPSGLEHFYGSFSTHALFHTARKIVEALVVQVQSTQSNLSVPADRLSSRPSIVRLSQILDQTALPQIVQSFNTWSLQPYDEDDLKMQPQRFALPPIRLLEESLPYFFDESYFEWPLFRRKSVLDAIRIQYATPQRNHDLAWSLCFNNIILLSLCSKSESTGVRTALLSPIENGLLTSLIANAKLAFNLTPYLMSPRLINVQALLSLALVARDFIHYSIFERALVYAYQVANAMGLQEGYSREITSKSVDSERRHLLWTIYVLDKQRCFIRGAPCLIYQFECSIALPEPHDSAFGQYRLAQIQLTLIMEEIYRALYSPRSKQRTSRQLDEGLQDCDRQLKSWATINSSLMDEISDAGGAQNLFAQQLRYSHYSCRIMVHRRGSSTENQHVCLESAREALKIVQKLARGAESGKQELAALRRIFNSCSIMAYYELWVHVLYSPCRGLTDDVALLVDVSKALDSLANPAYPQAYCARVSRAIKWCTDIAQVIQDAKLPDGNLSPNVQLPTHSPSSQVGAWELLAPAFYSTSPYSYNFVDGGMTDVRGQSPADVEGHLQSGGSFLAQLQQHAWPQQSNVTLSTNPSDTMSLTHLGDAFVSAGLPLSEGMETNSLLSTDLTNDPYYT